jgi:hypothetical protein
VNPKIGELELKYYVPDLVPKVWMGSIDFIMKNKELDPNKLQ